MKGPAMPPEALIRAVDRLAMVQDRFDSQHSDPTGTSAGDDGENADGRRAQEF